MAKLLYFGRLSQTTQTDTEIRALPKTVTNTAELRIWLDQIHNTDGALMEPTVRIAINNDIANEPTKISDEDEIAFLPPVGGG